MARLDLPAGNSGEKRTIFAEDVKIVDTNIVSQNNFTVRVFLEPTLSLSEAQEFVIARNLTEQEAAERHDIVVALVVASRAEANGSQTRLSGTFEVHPTPAL
jgi:hypothetical protein